jgi:CheY-like chemotaxis protein
MAAILLVEDSRIIRLVIRHFLEWGGHDVTECSGGVTASLMLDRNRFDAIVTDVCMPDGDGIAFITDQRSSGATTPIVAITGGDFGVPKDQCAQRAVDAGADHVLMKPVKKNEMLAAIAAFMASRARALP